MSHTDQINLELIVNLLGPEFLEDHRSLAHSLPAFPDPAGAKRSLKFHMVD